jgi:hypothetical protein
LRRNIFRCKQVFGSPRDSIQRTAQFALHRAGLGGAGLIHGKVFGKRNESKQMRIDCLRTFKKGPGQFDRGNLPGADEAAKFTYRPVGQVLC